MQNRLKLIRTDKNMSQDEFGKTIGISRSQIGCYEKGIREITERSINDICREFNVNKDWLITGQGDMYDIPIEDERITKALAAIAKSENEKLKSTVEKMLELDERYIDVILNLIDTVLEDQNKK